MGEATTVVVPMPHMGVSVEEGTVIEWLVAEGDEVSAEQVLCAIATDKVDTEVVAPADGVVARIVAEVGADVPVGQPLAELSSDAGAVAVDSPDATPRGEDEADASEVEGASRRVSGESTATALPTAGLAERTAAGRDEFGRFDPGAAAEAVLSFVATPTGTNGGAGVLASPIAKRMAASHGVELASLRGTGRAGRIRKVDVERAISADGQFVRDARTNRPRPSAPTPTQPVVSEAAPDQKPGDELPAGYADVPHEVVKTPRVRKVIAEHMARSRQTAAHMTTEVDVDLSTLTEVRAGMNAARLEAGEPKLSYLPFIARAACAALADFPELNATFLGERTIHWQQVNLGVAVDTEEGLLVPVVKACDQLTAPEIGVAIAHLAERARSRKLNPDDLAGGTFTLSNPGSVGAVSAPAIINQPQVAVLGIPAIQRRAWVLTDPEGNEQIAIRPILRLAVTFDHRALDGADATRFAVAVRDKLETGGPETYR